MKNRNKNLRTLIVNDIEYTYLIEPNDDKQETGNNLKIWKNKKLVYNEYHLEDSITPKMISIIITDNDEFDE